MFSKISLNLVIVGFCCHGNRQSNCFTGCLKYAFESFVGLLFDKERPIMLMQLVDIFEIMKLSHVNIPKLIREKSSKSEMNPTFLESSGPLAYISAW